MSRDPKSFLAVNVLNNGKIVTYRALGREFKVHSNVAKKMLYEFYSTQTTKSPRSINATYLLDGLSGAPKAPCINGCQQNGEGMHLPSSPYMSSSVPHQEDQEVAASARTILLVKEEDLEVAKAKFEQINSIHIYSLGPSRVQNLHILSDCNRAISVRYANDDPLIYHEQHGVIHNASVERRSERRPPIGRPTISAETPNEKVSSKIQGINRESRNAINPFAGPSSSDRYIESTAKAIVDPDIKAEGPRNVKELPASKPSAVKRQPSDMFKSFSGPKKSLKHEDTSISPGASLAPITAPQSLTQSVPEDELMKYAFEDEQEEDFTTSNSAYLKVSESQSERAEQLRKMMEDEDEEMGDTVDDAPQILQESEPLDGSISQMETSAEAPAVVTGGRRRGKRKVTKKKTIKDEEGYLVTKEEPVWESFSEDEPLPQKQKTFTSTATSSIGKGKKSGGKPGQGNIMSFFGKK